MYQIYSPKNDLVYEFFNGKLVGVDKKDTSSSFFSASTTVGSIYHLCLFRGLEIPDDAEIIDLEGKVHTVFNQQHIALLQKYKPIDDDLHINQHLNLVYMLDRSGGSIVRLSSIAENCQMQYEQIIVVGKNNHLYVFKDESEALSFSLAYTDQVIRVQRHGDLLK